MEKIKITGQTKDAGFQIGVRKTFNVPIVTIWQFLFSEKGLSTWLGKMALQDLDFGKSYKTEEGIEGKISVFKSNSHIRLTWKPKHWTNTSALQIRVLPVGEKTTISFHQDKLLDNRQREEMKQYWNIVIGQIENELCH